jgi:hypothetical protein
VLGGHEAAAQQVQHEHHDLQASSHDTVFQPDQ